MRPPLNHMMLNEDTLADEFDSILGYRTSHAGLVLSGGIYFDSAAAGGGDGTEGAPYNTLAALNALTGDQSGKVCYLKRGSTFSAPLFLNGVSNLTISTYGSGAKPVISNWTPVDSANWVDYTGTQADTYYMTAANWGSARCAVLLSAGGTDYPCYERGSIADLLLGYERASTGAAHLFTYFYDTGTSRMYIHVDPTVAANVAAVQAMTTYRPRTSSEETVQSGNYGLYLAATDNISVIDVAVTGARATNVLGSQASNTLLYGVESYYTGNLAGTGQNPFNFQGLSRASKSSGLILRQCVARDSFGSNNNGLEMSYMDDVLVEESEFMDIRANGIEFWQSCSNVIARRNNFSGTGSMFKFFDQDGDNLTVYQNILFVNNVHQSRASYEAKGTSAPTGGDSVVLCPFGSNYNCIDNVRVINNTFYGDDAVALRGYYNGSAVGGGNGTIRFRNNVVIMKQTTSRGYGQYSNTVFAPLTNATAAAWVVDRNAYQHGRDTLYGSVANVFGDSFAAYKARWDSAGASANEDASVQVAIATNFITTHGTMLTTDLRPHSGSAAMVGLADTSDPDYPTTDITGATRTRASAGAYD